MQFTIVNDWLICRVVATLEFCMTALEQLRSWAVFAIFPTDENQKDKYVQFVEQRYKCVMEPLRLFLTAIERSKALSEPMRTRRTTPRDRSYEKTRDSSQTARDHMTSPRDLRTRHRSGLGADISIQKGNRFKTQPESPRLGYRQSAQCLEPADDDVIVEDVPSPAEMTGAAGTPLREEVHRLAKQYHEEGNSIRDAVMTRLVRCRKDTQTLYKWGQASLLDLHELLDEALADELYFMVRSKMTRILATIGVFEEAAEQIERTLSTHFQKPGAAAAGAGSMSERGTSSTSKSPSRTASDSPSPLSPPVREKHTNAVKAERDASVPSMNSTSAAVAAANRMAPSDGASNPSNSGRFDNLSDLDLRIEIPPRRDSPTGSEGNELEDLLLAWSFNGNSSLGHVRLASAASGDVSSGRQSEASTPRSTPEPPLSPRPRALVKHPKIMKDKLQSMALPSKFPGITPNRFSASW